MAAEKIRWAHLVYQDDAGRIRMMDFHPGGPITIEAGIEEREEPPDDIFMITSEIVPSEVTLTIKSRSMVSGGSLLAENPKG